MPIALGPLAVAAASAHGAEPSTADKDGMIEVVLANGRILLIDADIDMAVLKRIAAALEEQA